IHPPRLQHDDLSYDKLSEDDHVFNVLNIAQSLGRFVATVEFKFKCPQLNTELLYKLIEIGYILDLYQVPADVEQKRLLEIISEYRTNKAVVIAPVLETSATTTTVAARKSKKRSKKTQPQEVDDGEEGC
ncbi:hypothetical protein HDU76_009234, partial [Blyttiomyces sp. JEL0837]